MADRDAAMATEGDEAPMMGQGQGGDHPPHHRRADAAADGGNNNTTTNNNPNAAPDDAMDADGGGVRGGGIPAPTAPQPPAARPPSAAVATATTTHAPLMPPPSATFAVPSRPRVLAAINVARDPVEEGSFEVRSPPTTRMRLTPPSAEAGGGGALGGGASAGGVLGGGGNSTVVDALGSPLSAPGLPRDRPSGPRPLHHHSTGGGARGALGDALRGGGGTAAAADAQQPQQPSGGFGLPQRCLGGITHVSSEPSFGLVRGGADGVAAGGGGGGGSGSGSAAPVGGGASPTRTPLASGSKPTPEFRFAAAELDVPLNGARSPSLIGAGAPAAAAAAATAATAAAQPGPRPPHNQQHHHHQQTPQPLAPGATRTPSGRPFTQQQQAQMMLGLLGGGGTPQQRGRSFEGEAPPPLSLAAQTEGAAAGRAGSPSHAPGSHRRGHKHAAARGGGTPLSATAGAAAAAAALAAAVAAGAGGGGPTPPTKRTAGGGPGEAPTAADNGYGTLWDEPMIARHASGKSGKAGEDKLAAAAAAAAAGQRPPPGADEAGAAAPSAAADGRGPAAMQASQPQQVVKAHAVEDEEAEGIDEDVEDEKHEKGGAEAHALAGQQEEEEEEEEGDEDEDDDDDDDDDDDGAAMARAEHGGLAAFLHGAAGAWGALPPRVCVNCTARVYGPAPCFSCGHRREDDALLLAGRLPPPAPAPAADALPHGPEGAPLLVYDDRLLKHHATEDGVADPTHPERPDRAAVVIARLEVTGLAGRCRRAPCRPATWGELTAVHDPALVRELEAQCSSMEAAVEAGIAPDPDAIGIACGREAGLGRVLDCYLGPETFECARLAAGAAAEAAVAVACGAAPCAAAVIRPPGHHAESGLAMGFCFFNNAAVAARAAQRAGCRRVLVLDNDVHHGNGTQHIFEGDPTVLYASVHRHDGGSFFPGTGAADEVGTGAGEGFTVNVPWQGPGPGDGDYVAAFCRVFLPVAYEFAPDLIVLSAGFDAALGDPLGGCRVTPAGYAHMVALLRPVAPLVVLLEGGYNLRATAESVEACVRVLAGERPPPLPRPAAPTEVGLAGVAAAVAAQRRYWRCLEEAVAPLPAAVVVPPGATPLRDDDDEEEDGDLGEAAFGAGGDGGGRGEGDEEGGKEQRHRRPSEGDGGLNDAGGAAGQDHHGGGGIGDGNNVRFALTIPEEGAGAGPAGGGGGPGGGGDGAPLPGLDVGALASPAALVSPMMHLSGGVPAAAAAPGVDHAMGEQPQQQQQGGADGG